MTKEVTTRAETPRTSLIERMASKYHVEPDKFAAALKQTAFKSDKPVSNEQFMALMVVADQYNLNPWTKEIYAFPDKGGIVPVIGVDGWARIINAHPQFDGVEFEQDDESCTCIIHRKDRNHATRVTEYLKECKRGTGPWGSHPKRMLRHKAMVQCARLAFGFVGIYDQDEAERIIEGEARVVTDEPRKGTTLADIKSRAAQAAEAEPAAAPEPEANPAPPPEITAADVLAKIEAARNENQVAEAMDLIRSLPDAEQAAVKRKAVAKLQEIVG